MGVCGLAGNGKPTQITTNMQGSSDSAQVTPRKEAPPKKEESIFDLDLPSQVALAHDEAHQNELRALMQECRTYIPGKWNRTSHFGYMHSSVGANSMGRPLFL